MLIKVNSYEMSELWNEMSIFATEDQTEKNIKQRPELKKQLTT